MSFFDSEGSIDVEGGRVWYCIAGEGKPGIPLLMLHGGPGAPHDYLEPLAAFADSRPVIFYDQLGCGNSDKPFGTTYLTVEHFVEELAEVRTSLGLDKLFLLGHSWGSMLAVEYMLTQKPSGVAGLVLSGPCLSVSRFIRDQRAYVARLPEDIRNAILEGESMGDFESDSYQNAMMFYYRRHVCRLDPWPECLNRTFEKMALDVYNHMWGPSEFTLSGTLKDFERAQMLGRIKIPALFSCGEFDEATPATTTHYHEMLPGSKIAIFAGASHEHHLEKSEQYIQIVRDFLHGAEM